VWPAQYRIDESKETACAVESASCGQGDARACGLGGKWRHRQLLDDSDNYGKLISLVISV